jgi:hypothetical protein
MDTESNPLGGELAPGCETSSDPGRRDGWTPFARRLFLQVLSETGRVKLACDYCRLSTQSAYALRHRDPLFAAGWDAACELARTPLADALYERAVDGFEETITRNGEVVATRHRFDSRLSIAVLHRLDKRCDRAAEAGARHLRLTRSWDEWLDLIGNGQEDAARDLLAGRAGENSSDHQFHQLLLGENPTGELPADVWQDEVGDWRTNFPPPDGFHGYEKGRWGDWNYQRDCNDEEAELLDGVTKGNSDERLSGAAAERDAYFAGLKTDLEGIGSPSTCHPDEGQDP